MQITLGSVYKDDQGIAFIATIDRIDGGSQDVNLRLVNVANWISLGTIRGKQLTNGRIDCPDLYADKMSMLAPTLFDYKPK